MAKQRLRSSPTELSALNAFQAANIFNFARYLENPDTASLISGDLLTTRGAAWHFLRYAADRKAGASGTESAFWRSLIDSRTNGLENLRTALGDEPLNWIQDWLVAVYADDAVSGLDGRFVQPSWNLRSLYSELRNQSNQPIWGRYPLRTRTLTAGTAEVLNVRAGSAAYLRFAVAAGGAGQVMLTDGDAAPNPAVKFTLVRTR